MTLNASNRKDIRRAEKAARIAEMHDREALRSIMSTLHGRAWMHRQLEAGHCFNDPFTGDALREAYHKGERNAALRLLAQLMMYCPDQYILMTREANERLISNNRDPNDTDDATGPTEHSGGAESRRVVEGSDSTTDDSGDDETGRTFDPDQAGWNLWRPGDIRVQGS